MPWSHVVEALESLLNRFGRAFIPSKPGESEVTVEDILEAALDDALADDE